MKTPDASQWRSDLSKLKAQALLTAARDYIGQGAGSSPGIKPTGPVDFRNRFTNANTHGFTALSNSPRFVVVRRKDGRWVGFMAPGYAAWKKKKFGVKPILIASGSMVRDLRAGAGVSLAGSGANLHARVHFLLSKIAKYHYTGDGVPRRDPISPSTIDAAAYKVRAAQVFAQLAQRWQAARR